MANIYPPPPNPPPAGDRLIGAGDTPGTHQARFGIVPPPFENNNFNIRDTTIHAVENNRFCGLKGENAIEHLDQFEKYCNLVRNNGVSEDAFNLRLFPFSLSSRAKQWEKYIPSASITTWQQCKDAFLARFYPSTKTAQLRIEIAGFQQKHNEDFAEALERFKGMLQECPHHGFSDEQQLSTIYRGVLPKIKSFLDSASDGSFLSRTIDAGWQLIDNTALSSGVDADEYDRRHRGSIDPDAIGKRDINVLTEKLDKLNSLEAKVDKLLSAQTRKQSHVSFAEDIPIEENDMQYEEVSYLQNQGNYRQNQGNYTPYKQNQNLSYQNNNVANPEDQVYPPNPQQQQQPRPFVPRDQYQNNYRNAPPAQQGYQRLPTAQPFHNPLPVQQPFQTPPPVQPPPQQPLPAAAPPDLTSMLQQLLQGQTSMQANLNAKIDNFHNVLSNQIQQLNSRIQVVESNLASSSVRSPGQLPGKAVQNPKEYNISSITLRSGRELPEQDKEDDVTEDSNVQVGGSYSRENTVRKEVREQEKTELKTHNQKDKAQIQPGDTQKLTPPVPRQYIPEIPFPQRFKKGGAEKYKSLFDKQLQEIELRIPILDAFVLVPRYLQFLKDAIKGRTKELEGMQVETHECSPLMQMSIVKKKLEDPGTFTIPCSIGQSTFRKCMCDLGASISLMPLSVARRLGYNTFKPCNISLILADRSVRSPYGLLEDLPVRIGNVEVPTDFVVLDMGEETENPLLLGRPFLASAGALIDVKSGTIELDNGTHSRMIFDISDATGKPTIGGQTFSIEGLDQIDAKPLKGPQVLMKRSSKASDDPRLNPMYEEVVDGKSLESLFACNETENSASATLSKPPALDLGPDIILKPLGYINGAMEYKVKGTSRFKTFAKVRQLLSHSKLQSVLSGPFDVKTVMPCGTITLVGKKGEAVPLDGQRVKLYLVAETERTSPPLPDPPYD